MALEMLLGRRGWRKTAVVNIGLSAALTTALTILIGIAAGTSGGSLTQNTALYHGSCATAAQINIALHLIINIISTGLLASSNFFIQVLNAPSRREVEAAHRKQKTLAIGVQSAGNLAHISRFKLVSILLLALSSLPVHLLFNSVVFQSDFLGGRWQMTLAAESFAQGAEYAVPGAYLAVSGFWPDYGAVDERYRYSSFRHQGGFGERVNATEYANETAPIVLDIRRAAKQGSSWVRLDPRACRRQYIACEPRRTYGDVILVIRTGNPASASAQGWTRDQVVNTSVFDQESAAFWRNLDLLPPADQVNPLWYSAACTVS